MPKEDVFLCIMTPGAMRVAFKCYIEPLGKGNEEISRLEKKDLTFLVGGQRPRHETSIAPNRRKSSR